MVAKLTQHNLLKQFVEIVVWHKSVIFLDCLHQGQFFSLFSSSSEWVSWLPPWSAEEQTQCSLCSSKGHLPVARTTFQLQEEERVCRTVTSWSSVYDLWARVCAGWSSVHDLWGSVQVEAQCMTCVCEEECVQVEAQWMTGWSLVSDLWGRECGFCHRRQQRCWSCPGAPP